MLKTSGSGTGPKRAGQQGRKRTDFRTGTARKYATVVHAKGPAIYRRTDVYNTIARMMGVKRGQLGVKLVDLGSGRGLVGSKVAAALRKRGASVIPSFIDLSPGALSEVARGPLRATHAADLRRTLRWENTYTHAVSRFAVKNVPQKEQMIILRETNRIMKRGGVFVLMDMVSPEGLQEFQNAERIAKNHATGDFFTRNNVPTEKGWRKMMQQAGFNVTEVEMTTSKVNTRDWVKSNQMPAGKVREYVQALERLLERFPDARRAYQIKKVGGDHYEITYPVMIMKAVKP
ncbi:class I SAM-dependent methyltransferase [Candidatus Micrarchaeota archaeon]|nr:class I SAM-dependent methyltransferase [Candidatus Micrarchaeota archaeon]MBU1930114.1 class I SAM-dependent methyltransferase [Candidatus Micrarchaeota archaeon]